MKKKNKHEVEVLKGSDGRAFRAFCGMDGDGGDGSDKSGDEADDADADDEDDYSVWVCVWPLAFPQLFSDPGGT